MDNQNTDIKNNFAENVAKLRKAAKLTQAEFAEEMCVTRQTVSRWEAGTVMPDIDKIADIASYLGVSCDYLLKDGITEENPVHVKGIGRLLSASKGKIVKLRFFDGEADVDLGLNACRILEFEGNWVKVEADTKKGHVEKLIPLSSVQSIAICGEGQ